jgi:transcriptional regulator with XRE-family HTH domain
MEAHEVRRSDIIRGFVQGEREMASKLGEKLRACRTAPKLNLTLEEAARRAGLSKSYLWELENRESQKPSAEKLQAIADVLGQDVSFFLDDTIDTPQESNKDKEFFRSYAKLEPEAKEKLRQILDVLKKPS